MAKNRLTIFVYIALLLITAGVFITAGCADKSKAQDGSGTLYTCGMHPDVISDEPGLCPICNMNLVPMGEARGSGTGVPEGERRILYWVAPMDPTYISDSPGKSPMGMDLIPVYEDEVMSGTGVTIDPAVIQNMGVRYAQVERGVLSRTIRAAAHVDYNENNLAVLSTKTDGWIEKLYVTSPGTQVKAGDPLFEFYSPKLFSAQEEYRIALKSGDASLLQAVRERLRFLGISDSQINEITAKGTNKTMTIKAPISGIVTAVGQSGGTMGTTGSTTMGGMSGMGGSMAESNGGMNVGSGATIREGDYVGSGTTVFTIADLSSLWIYAHLYDDELPFVKTGMKANLELDYLPGEIFEGTIDFIYPFLDRQTRDIKIRMTLENPDGKLLPQMYGRVSIESEIEDDTLIIPKESVIFSGDERIVFLALPAGKFAPQKIITGASDGRNQIQVLSGLYPGQTIVTSGQFLLDSESRLKEAVAKMLADRTGTVIDDHAEHIPAAVESDNEWVDLAPDDPNAKFRCPMPEDRYYTSEDGECPICGMFLEPHDPSEYAATHDHDLEEHGDHAECVH